MVSADNILTQMLDAYYNILDFCVSTAQIPSHINHLKQNKEFYFKLTHLPVLEDKTPKQAKISRKKIINRIMSVQ